MRKNKIVVFTVIITFLLSSTVSAFSIKDLLKKQKDIEKKKESIDKKIDQIQSQKVTIEAQLEKVNGEIDKIQDELNDINGKLFDNEVKIKDLNLDMNALNKKSDEQKKVLQARLKVYYENGNISYLDVILSSENFTDMVSRLELLKQIVGYDKSILEDLSNIQKELTAKKLDLEKTKAAITQSKQKVEEVKKKQLEIKAQKDTIMSQLSDEQKKAEKEYEDLEDASNKITQDIQRAQAPSKSVPYTGGKLGWPVEGYYNITSPFGMRIHPILKVPKLHTGMDVGAPMGATMAAAADGTVIGASYMGGYGNTVIIDHGGGISTLYAHNSYILVSVGQKVKRGQAISRVGSTGNSTGPHAHFEVRINGKYVDPLPYLR